MAYTKEGTEKDHGRLALLSSACFIAMTVPRAPGMGESILPVWLSITAAALFGILGLATTIGFLLLRGFSSQRGMSIWLLGLLLASIMIFIRLHASTAYWSTIASILVGLIIAFAASGKGNLFDFTKSH